MSRMGIRALIVDDEPPARDELAWLLSRHGDIEVVQADGAGRAVEAIRRAAPDVVFQDIQMPGKDGFHVLAEAIELPRPPLFVFVTAFDRYAVQAFEAQALDYLLKPVAEERLAECLRRVRARVNGQAGRAQFAESAGRLLESVPGAGRLARVPIEQGGRIRLVRPESVLMIEADEKRVTALTDQGRFAVHGLPTLCRVEERLAGLPFFRIHRGALVNLERVAELAPWIGGKYHLTLDDPARTEAVVSRNRARDFKERVGL